MMAHAAAMCVQEFAVLGSQTLDVLRDSLKCSNDANMAALGRTKPSAYIHIEGVFYSDERAAGAHDLSEPLRKFLLHKGVSAPPDPTPGCCEGTAPPSEELEPGLHLRPLRRHSSGSSTCPVVGGHALGMLSQPR